MAQPQLPQVTTFQNCIPRSTFGWISLLIAGDIGTINWDDTQIETINLSSTSVAGELYECATVQAAIFLVPCSSSPDSNCLARLVGPPYYYTGDVCSVLKQPTLTILNLWDCDEVSGTCCVQIWLILSFEEDGFCGPGPQQNPCSSSNERVLRSHSLLTCLELRRLTISSVSGRAVFAT